LFISGNAILPNTAVAAIDAPEIAPKPADPRLAAIPTEPGIPDATASALLKALGTSPDWTANPPNNINNEIATQQGVAIELCDELINNAAALIPTKIK